MAETIRQPMNIETESFSIIERELLERDGLCLAEPERPLILRMIHATADFEYARLARFQGEPVKAGLSALTKGCAIYADTAMICAGVNARKLEQFGCRLLTHIADDDVRREAAQRGVTRSRAAMEKACLNPDIGIFVIGNAPTALFALLELMDQGKAKPDLIIGVPVGFVGAAQSKDALMDAEVPSIAIKGRKGGSTVAVSILNALFYMLDNER